MQQMFGKYGLLIACMLLSLAAAHGDSVSAGPIYDIEAFGADGDGEKLNTEAIQKAIDQCAEQGGGIVRVSAGVFRTGTIRLRSHVTLHLMPGAVLLGSEDRSDYRRDMIHIDGASHVGITGSGVIDASGPAFWEKRHDRAHQDSPESWRYVATWDYAHAERPGHAIRFLNSEHIRIRDVTIRNSPSWTLSFNNCRDVLVDGITIRNPLHGPNTDGIDIMSSENVRIVNCDIRTGDDAIVLKNDPRHEFPTRNVTVANCVLSSVCNGFKLGTESRWGFENITFSNSIIYSDDDMPPPFRVISGVAIETVDGGILRNVTVSNIVMKNVRAPFFIRLGNRGRDQEEPVPGSLRGVLISNVIATGAVIPSSITGQPGYPVEEVTLRDIHIETTGGGTDRMANRRTPMRPADYPEAFMFGSLPAYGLYCRYIRNLRLENVHIVADAPDARPVLVAKHGAGLRINGFSTELPDGGERIRLYEMEGVTIPPDGISEHITVVQK